LEKEGVTGLCVGYESGEWRTDDFVDFIMEWLPEFALNSRERENLVHENAVATLRKAAKLIYKSKKFANRGEFGELFLHAAIRSVFNSTPAISKIFYKSSHNETVKGFDCVHVVGPLDDLELWIGEVKFYSDLKKAVYDVIPELELAGMPGCGKSMSAKAAASLFNVPLLRLDIVADDVLRSSVEAAEQTSKLMTVTKGAGKVAKVAGPIALVIEAGVRGKSAYDTEQDYERGDISDDERVIRHARNGGQLAGGVAGAAGGAWAGAAAGACTGPAAPVCVPVFAVAGGIAGGLGGDALGGNCAAYIAEKRTQIRQRTHELKVHVEQEILEIEQDWNDLKGRCQHMFSKGS
jgi:hypothetical protein